MDSNKKPYTATRAAQRTSGGSDMDKRKLRIEQFLARAHRALWEACEESKDMRTDDLADDLFQGLMWLESVQVALLSDRKPASQVPTHRT